MTSNATNAVASNVITPRPFTPKRGIPSMTIELNEEKIEFKPHHQKTLILELLNDGTNTLKDMIEKVEASKELQARLKSKQSVFNCITYHIKDLAKLKVIFVK